MDAKRIDRAAGKLRRSNVMQLLIWACMGLPLSALPASAQSTSTFTLDALSFVSFQDVSTFSLPSGSTLTFEFDAPAADGSIDFSIPTSGVSIPALDMPGDSRTLQYGIASDASGSISPSSDGYVIQFSAAVTADLNGPLETAPPNVYSMPFTTETVTATDILGQLSIERTGFRLVDGVWYAQIVAATTNKANAFPEPGAAVYAVLSGQFDSLPIAP